jgi:serine protease Do
MAIAFGGALVGLLVTGLGEAQDGSGSFAGPPSFADVIEDVSPAVVTVSVMKDVVRVSGGPNGSPFAGSPFEDFLDQFGFGGQNFQMPSPAPRAGEGSGFIIDEDGYIATNYHVVDGASEVVVTLDSGEELNATVVGTDPLTDLALLKVDNGRDLPSLAFGDSDRARVGDWVLAIGNPFGLGGTATAGIISARSRDINAGRYDDFLQVDAAVNSGNSGGPIFNSRGEVIGINTAIISPNGGSVGIGFAIPSNQARNVLDELRDGGVVSRGWLGVEITSVARDDDDAAGAVIARVVADGPADRAGLEAGDIVTEFDGERVDTPRTLSRLVGELDAGDEVDIEFIRDGDRRESTTVLGALDDSNYRAQAAPEARDPRNYRYYRYQLPETPNRR